MKAHANSHKDEHDSLDAMTDEARSLIAATADAADEKIVKARNRLAATLDAAKDTYAAVQKKAVAGAKATDEMIREKPYHAIGVAFAVGALVGFFLSRRGKS